MCFPGNHLDRLIGNFFASNNDSCCKSLEDQRNDSICWSCCCLPSSEISSQKMRKGLGSDLGISLEFGGKDSKALLESESNEKLSWQPEFSIFTTFKKKLEYFHFLKQQQRLRFLNKFWAVFYFSVKKNRARVRTSSLISAAVGCFNPRTQMPNYQQHGRSFPCACVCMCVSACVWMWERKRLRVRVCCVRDGA